MGRCGLPEAVSMVYLSCLRVLKKGDAGYEEKKEEEIDRFVKGRRGFSELFLKVKVRKKEGGKNGKRVRWRGKIQGLGI